MDISKEVIIDILENLSDDELRLFLEHLVNNNDFAKESLYKYYQGLMNNKHSELIPINASDQEQKAMIDQMKADSILLWKRK